MRRAAIERPQTVRRWRAHARVVHDSEPTGCVCDEQPGRFRKGQRVAGCPLPRCMFCKADKLLGGPRMVQRRSDLSFAEWITDPTEGVSDPRLGIRWDSC